MDEEMRTNDVEMTEQEIASAKEQRRLELEREFSYKGYFVIRKELHANLRDPSITVRARSVTFNTSCIEALTDAVYVRLYFNEELRRLAVRRTTEHDKNALRWCVAKGGKRKSRMVTCPDLTKLFYTTMKWDKKCRYKILGYLINVSGEDIFVVDFTATKIYHERPKKGEPGYDQPIDRKGFYSDDVANTYGVPAEEYEAQTEVFEEDGYINVALLTGPRRHDSPNSEDRPSTDEQIRFGGLDVAGAPFNRIGEEGDPDA